MKYVTYSFLIVTYATHNVTSLYLSVKFFLKKCGEIWGRRLEFLLS